LTRSILFNGSIIPLTEEIKLRKKKELN